MKCSRVVCLVIGACLTLAPTCLAMTYFQDPVFIKPNAETPHPLEEILALADDNDVRAAFILGDLYEKGKGGMPRNAVLSQRWFEKSAIGGYPMSYVRLAAKAKSEKNFTGAYQWYSLAMDYYPSGKMRKYLVTARNTLIKDAGLGKDDIHAVDKAMADFRRAQKTELARRNKRLAEQRAQERARERELKRQEKDSAPVKTQSFRKGDFNG